MLVLIGFCLYYFIYFGCELVFSYNDDLTETSYIPVMKAGL